MSLRRAIDALSSTSLEGAPSSRLPMILGYSYGGQVAISALQNPSPNWQGAQYRAVLIVPALERDFIHSQINADQLSISTKQMVALLNKKRPYLKANKLLCQKGFRRSQQCDYRISSKIGCPAWLEEIDVSAESSRKHSLSRYSKSPSVNQAIHHQLLTQIIGE